MCAMFINAIYNILINILPIRCTLS